MKHSAFDHVDHTARVLEALILARAMTGDRSGRKLEKQLRARLFSTIAADGLSYEPNSTFNFAHANMHYQRSVMMALTTGAIYGDDEECAEKMRGLVDAVSDIAIYKDDFAYFPAVEYFPGGWRPGDWRELGWCADPAHTNGRQINPLARFAEASGYEPALELARLFANHVVYHSSAFTDDGDFATGYEFREGHLHSRATTLVGVLRYGLLAGDSSIVAWAKKVYEKARCYGTSFGWFPERLVPIEVQGAETCAIVDMIEAAILLAGAGYRQYWDDVERFVRNHLVENQLMEVPIVSRRPSKVSEGTGQPANDEWCTYDDVLERSVGGFAGWSLPNDLVNPSHDWDIFMCCTPSGVRGLNLALEHAVVEDSRGVWVNLLLDSDAPSARVISDLPNRGLISVTAKHGRDYFVRIPPWVSIADVTVTGQDGESANWCAESTYIRLRERQPGSTSTINFPVRESRERLQIANKPYTVSWRGDRVVDIEPRGRRIPLYTGHLDSGSPEPQEAE